MSRADDLQAAYDKAAASVLVRVADLWPEYLEPVPGSGEIALKRDADTIRQAVRAIPDLLPVVRAAQEYRKALQFGPTVRINRARRELDDSLAVFEAGGKGTT